MDTIQTGNGGPTWWAGHCDETDKMHLLMIETRCSREKIFLSYRFIENNIVIDIIDLSILYKRKKGTYLHYIYQHKNESDSRKSFVTNQKVLEFLFRS